MKKRVKNVSNPVKNHFHPPSTAYFPSKGDNRQPYFPSLVSAYAGNMVKWLKLTDPPEASLAVQAVLLELLLFLLFLPELLGTLPFEIPPLSGITGYQVA